MSDFFLGTGRLPPSLRSESDSAPAEENYSQSSRHASYDREDATDRHSRDDVRDGDWRSERFREISQGPCGCPSTREATIDAHFENIALKILSVPYRARLQRAEEAVEEQIAPRAAPSG